ncbi:C39 family peptidase [Paenibacillus sp. 32352]|uniref:C39 family peptidase n=1 Tax=Paenibacillus sp. 32352 TaxID=1969111 RepID=UPI00117F74C3|nr:C39 family peptidase [Paenibacillus sp. 32352]
MKKGRNRIVWTLAASACAVMAISFGYLVPRDEPTIQQPTGSADPPAVLHTMQLQFQSRSLPGSIAEGTRITEPDVEQYPFRLYQQDRFLLAYTSYPDAVNAAKGLSNTGVYFKSKDKLLWSSDEPLASTAQTEAPLIYQMPELDRGCEVTSLAMLLQSAGVNVDKMTLADEIRKDPNPFEIIGHEIHFGNPNEGFVGDIASFDHPGYGVYHGPIMELAKQYLPGRAVDATGSSFDDVLRLLEAGSPVWVVTNMEYTTLDEDAFETWETEDGGIDITYKEHSVLITGYDEDTVYINDPLGETEEVDKADFISAWEQMGRQAIAYVR